MRLVVVFVAIMMSVGALGDVNAQNAGSGTAQVTRPATPKCTIVDAKDCTLSKSRKEYVRFKTPKHGERYVCFDTDAPFGQPEFHIAQGQHQDTPDIVGDPPSGTEYLYNTYPDKCSAHPRTRNPLNSAKIIISD